MKWRFGSLELFPENTTTTIKPKPPIIKTVTETPLFTKKPPRRVSPAVSNNIPKGKWKEIWNKNWGKILFVIFMILGAIGIAIGLYFVITNKSSDLQLITDQKLGSSLRFNTDYKLLNFNRRCAVTHHDSDSSNYEKFNIDFTSECNNNEDNVLIVQLVPMSRDRTDKSDINYGDIIFIVKSGNDDSIMGVVSDSSDDYYTSDSYWPVYLYEGSTGSFDLKKSDNPYNRFQLKGGNGKIYENGDIQLLSQHSTSPIEEKYVDDGLLITNECNKNCNEYKALTLTCLPGNLNSTSNKTKFNFQ